MTKLVLYLHALLVILPGVSTSSVRADNQSASGYVFHDQNGNRTRDTTEPGLPDVRLSNGRTVVETDAQGRYELPVDEDTILFVIKPRGWMVPIDQNNVPRFYYIHKPNGSPQGLKYAGVEPTGPLPSSVDFPLVEHPEPDKFQIVVFGDPQPNNLGDIYHMAHDIVDELVGTEAVFGLTLGDVMADLLDLYQPYNEVMGQIGMPMYNTLGNHDINFDVPSDELSDETWEQTFGPATFSFDWGPVHFIVTDNVYYGGGGEESGGGYHGEFTEKVLDFVENDLQFVPKDQLVVLSMHMPLTTSNHGALLALIADRPNTVSLSGHTHDIEHQFIGIDQDGPDPDTHHHVINGAICGIHWLGSPDEYGIPHAMTHCGSPNGYTFVTFDDSTYTMRFKAPRRPASDQMHIYTSSEVKAAESGDTEVLVNVYFGSAKSKTEMRLDDGAWVELKREEREDPYLAKVIAAGHPLSQVTHMWVGHLPVEMTLGGHTIHVRTTDMFGQTFTAARVVRVVSD